jgi:phosphatidylserine/phosphatidylglycerophosphate/cardiolipin synthase-like enzyme
MQTQHRCQADNSFTSLIGFEKKQEYCEFLKRDGVRVTYNNTVHAKLIVVDRTAAVTSSMNFNTRSSGGASWEAGIISTEEIVVESVANSFLRLLENLESVELV